MMRRHKKILGSILTATCILGLGCADSIKTSNAQEVAMSEPTGEGPVLYISEMGEEVVYDLASRFMMTISKEKLEKVTSVEQIDKQVDFDMVVSYDSVHVIVLDHEYDFVEIAKGNTAEFNEEQLALLHSAEYSTDILIRAHFKEDQKLGFIYDNYTSPHLTIVPEKQAEYSEGWDAVEDYIRENTKTIPSTGEMLGPGKVRFTITAEGVVDEVFLDSSCGNKALNSKVIELIKNLPGTWTSGENEKEKSIARIGVLLRNRWLLKKKRPKKDRFLLSKYLNKLRCS